MSLPDIYINFLEDLERNKPVITEEMFKEFIPFFFAKAGDITEDEYNEYLDRWLDYAKDPRLEVRVVDKELTKVLFVVPPILSTTNTKNVRVSTLVDQWILHSELSPLHGNSFFKRHFTSSMFFKANLTENTIGIWAEIYNRYHRELNENVVSSEPSLEFKDSDDDW